MKQVTLYMHETCPYCHMTMDLLKEKGVEYTKYDVLKDDTKADEMIQLTGENAVPVLVVREGDKESIVVGFDKPKIEDALAA